MPKAKVEGGLKKLILPLSELLQIFHGKATRKRLSSQSYQTPHERRYWSGGLHIFLKIPGKEITANNWGDTKTQDIPLLFANSRLSNEHSQTWF